MAKEPKLKPADRIENWKGKTILLFTPHPDDDTFECGGTLAKLAANGNKIHIVIYTSDNAGSNDPAMTKERLAEIRKREEEAACKVLGIGAGSITWIGYDDGMLEYVDKRELTKQAAREIRRHRPDAVFTLDPGAVYDQYHKSDHRAAAIVGVDAMRAAGWRLYFPELEKEGFAYWRTPVAFFYYSADPNYTVDITAVAKKKADACAEHFSQFGDAVTAFSDSVPAEEKKKLAKRLLAKSSILVKSGKKYVERFRRGTGYGE